MYPGAIQPPASTVETVYSKLRRSIALARYNNPRLNGLLANPPTITAQASLPVALTASFLANGTKANVFRSYGGYRVLSTNYWNMVSCTFNNASLVCQHVRHETIVDSAYFAYRIFGSNNQFRLLVDGQYVDTAGTSPFSSTGEQFVVVDFTTAGGRKPRKISFEWYSKGVGFGGIYTGPTETCIQPAPSIRGICLGDSYFGGGGVTLLGDGLPAQIGDFLGVQDMWGSGIGGTGFLNPGSVWKYRDHISDLTGNTPDFAIIGSAANDQFSYSAADITAEVSALIAAVRAVSATSKIPLFFPGSWSNQHGVISSNLAADAAVGAAVTAAQTAGDQNIFYIPVVADTNGSWITGTGNTGSPAADGNCDVYGAVDGSHLNATGWTYMAGRFADQIATAIKDK